MRELIQQLDLLGYGAGDRVHYRAFYPLKQTVAKGDSGRKTSATYGQIPPELDQWQQEGRGIYIVVNLGGAGIDDITECAAVFYEHDSVRESGLAKLQNLFPGVIFPDAPPKNDGKPQWYVPKDVQSQLWAALGLPQPTFQVDTGGKSIHSYWTLTERCDPDAWRSLQTDLLEFADADRSLKNQNRVMRAAGFIHPVSGEAAKLLQGSGERYDYATLRALVPQQEAARPRTQPIPSAAHSRDDDRAFARELLRFIPVRQPGTGSYEESFKVLAALVHKFGESEGLQIAREWSPDEDWGEDLGRKARSLRGGSNPVTFGSLVKIAQDNGWKPLTRTPAQNVVSTPRQMPSEGMEADADVADDLSQRAEDLEALVTQYANESSPTKRALLKAKISADFKIGRSDLLALEAEFRTPPAPSFHHISMPVSGHDCDYLQLLERKASGEIPAGLPTGFFDLDAKIIGLKPRKLYLVAGRPSMGKSAFTENIALNAAKAGVNVLIHTLEMSTEEWIDRAVSMEAGIDGNTIASGRLDESDFGRVCMALPSVLDLPVFLDERTGITINDMRNNVVAMTEMVGAPGLIIVDYINLLKAAIPNANRTQEMSAIARDLQEFTKECNCPVIALSQLSRDVSNRQDKRPVESDLRESGELEQVADVILMLYREEKYDPETTEKGIAEVLIRKNRQGATGTVKLLFEPQFTRFRNLARGDW